MKDIKNLSIWKQETKTKERSDAFMDVDISELNLSVRSYNCLKRAGCNVVRDIFYFIGEDGTGLRKIRNLGSRSEKEIIDTLQGMEKDFTQTHQTHQTENVPMKRSTIKQNKMLWDMRIEQLHLSNYAMQRLTACGIRQVRDLYATNPKKEPGWYAVRELLEKL